MREKTSGTGEEGELPALSLALFFARAPLSERLEEAIVPTAIHPSTSTLTVNLLDE